MKAVIMAGGKGTRLRPLTCNKPKPMAPIVNRPMMEHILYLLKKHGFNEVLVTLFYLPELIRNYFGDGSEFGMKIRYSLEETPLGTAGSVKKIIDELNDTFLVISGDALTDFNLKEAIKFHRDKKAKATIVLTKVSNPLEYGVVITDQNGAVKRFLEKPGWGEVFSDTVNTGIYVLEPEIFDLFEHGKEFDFSKNLFPLLLEKGELICGYVADGYWSDIGNLEQYRQAHYDVLTGKVKVSIPGREVKPGIWLGEAVEIDPKARIEGPVLLGDYCRIKADTVIEGFTVIGNYGIVNEGTSIKRGILWNHCYVGPFSEIRGAVLCHHTYLKGKNSVYEGAVIGEGVSMGGRSTIKPDVKVWPNKNIESGSVLNESMIWAKKNSRSLFGNNGISGTINQEITPELVAKLGGIFGAYLKPGAKIVVGSDSFRAARVFKRALISGVLAAGCGVYDLGTLPTALTRHALALLGAQGGAQLRINPNDTNGLLIEFMDQKGLNIDKNTERAIENSYMSEDFPRAGVDNFGELAFVPQLIEPYLNGLISPEIKELIKKRNFKVVFLYDDGNLSFILPGLLEMLGCRVKTEGYGVERSNQPRSLHELLGAIGKAAEIVRSEGADLGIIADQNAERLILLDETGDLLKEEQLIALLSFLTLKYKPEAVVPVQVTAPHYIETLAKEFRGKVIRTKANPRSLMEKTAQEKLFPTIDGRGSYFPQFDAVFSLVKVMELIAREEISLSKAKAMIPKVERGYLEAECPWDEKGRVMRELFEENQGLHVETTDGLKIFHDQGWALVLPDADEPVFKIYAEANTSEEADALTQMYWNRISQLRLQ
ncbi:MAG: NTP transferase domain-containing protein [Firmicutes bacterium]|nr:NTP transferase domain-containing protein [Bacillota bacterium]